MTENRPFSLFRKNLAGKYMCDGILFMPWFLPKKFATFLSVKLKLGFEI